MNLQQLIYFRKIAELQHYTKAAEALHITQPCLSHAISDLEDELGVPLFSTSGRNSRLTPYGASELTHVQEALDALDAGRKEIEALTKSKSGTVSIVHISSMSAKYLPMIMHAFHSNPENRKIRLEFSVKPTMQFLPELKDHRFDIGLGSWPGTPQFETKLIYRERMVLIVNPAHPLAAFSSVTMQDISPYDFIAYDRKCGIRHEIDRLFTETGTRCRIIHEIEDNTVITGLVSAGIGIAIVPELFEHEYYGVKGIPITGVDTQRGLYMIWNKGDCLSPAAAEFVSFMKTFSSQDFPRTLESS